MRIPNAPSRAFTIIELIVTIGLTVMMLVLINQLFFNTSKAVSQGAQLSEIIGKDRAAIDQFRRDAAAMVGPQSSPPGFLVIINKKFFGMPVPFPRDGGGAERSRDIRSDQLVFIRKADGLSPITPGNFDKFTNGAIGSYARVWYGHVRLTDLTGTTDTGDVGNTTPGNLNRLGTNWSIGRQVLLFATTPDTVCATPTAASYVFNSPVSAALAYPGPGPSVLYMGLSDVFAFPLQDGTNGVVDPNLGNKWQLGGGLAEMVYEDLAMGYAFPGERLRMNPVPAGSGFAAWQIAQMHSAFLANASDFEVSFAADLNGDGNVDVEPTTGQIYWYDAYHYGATGSPPFANYGFAAIPAAGAYEPDITGVAGYPNALVDQAFVFRHDDNNSVPNSCRWPYLIRIRYRLHDSRGEFESNGIELAAPNTDTRVQGKWFEQIIKVNRP